MYGFVEAHSPRRKLRERFGFALGKGRVNVLLQLADGPRSLGDIAQRHGVDAPYATIIVDKLESLGFVERTVDPRDRRRKLVGLTPAGREVVDLAHEAIHDPPPPLAGLSERELERLESLLHRLA
jgi:DNA-binding MarR family transcriptional regulator